MSAEAEAARRSLEEARRAVGAVGAERLQVERDARRLRARSGAARGLADLAELAREQEERAARLGARAEELRDVAQRAEVAWERLRRDDADTAGPEPTPAAP